MNSHLIVTADDFGLHDRVNEAVEDAAQHGVLTAASLMVGAPAAPDAVRRAARLPNLRIGLHLVLADGIPVLDSTQIPDLIGADGRLGNNMAHDGLRYFLLPKVRRQLEAEIRAQFAAFADTGLPLDHVNTHKHFHFHPTVLEIILRVGRDYGSPPVRALVEPLWFSFSNGATEGLAAMLLRPWAWLLGQKLSHAHVPHNRSIFGLAASGAMDEGVLLQILARLPAGVSEIYLHPAITSGSIVASMRGYRHKAEWAALMSSQVRAAILASGASCGGFRDIPI